MGESPDSLADYASLPNVGGTKHMLLSGGLAVVLHPDRQIFLDRRSLYLKSGEPEVQCNHFPETLLTGPPEHRMMPLSSVQTYAYPQYLAQPKLFPPCGGA